MNYSVARPFSGRSFSFWALVLVIFSGVGPAALAQSVVINEVDADQVGTDAAEFIELFDGGSGNTDLSGQVLVLFNGNGDASYQAFDLDGFSTGATGYFVICGNAANVANCDLDVSPNTNLIQNGADAAALYTANAADFPSGTPVTTTNLNDALVYDTDDSDDAGLLVLLNAGQPQVNENGGGDGTGHSNQRCPNGAGGARNTSGYQQAAPTPGIANTCGEPPPRAIVINEVDADQVSTDSAEFVELYDGGVGNTDLTGLVVVLMNGSDDASYLAFSLDGRATNSSGYFVLCGNAANVANCDMDVLPDTNLIQNGADAVALYTGSDTDFPNDTPVTDVNLVDAIVYDTDDSDDAGLLAALLNPGQPQVNERDGGDGTAHSNQRCANGSGGARNTDTYAQFLPTPGTENVCVVPIESTLIINEVDADQSGTDSAEFVELYDGGVGNTDLSGLSIVLFNGSDDASYRAYDLDGFSTNGTGYFVLCGDAGNVANCDLDVSTNTNLIQNGADAVALISGDAVNFPNDTPLTTINLIDAIVYDTNDGDDAALLVLLNVGQPQVNEGGNGNSAADSNQRCSNGSGGARNTSTYAQFAPTPGAENICVIPVVGPFEIFQIQGSGPASPYDGQTVITENNVVTAVGPNGFFMQTPAGRSDNDVDTSDGIYVFTGGAPMVAAGDLVTVTGSVVEFFDFTEFTGSPDVTLLGSGGTIPAAVVFDATTPSPDPMTPSCAIEMECYEGMLVSIEHGTVTGPNQGFRSDPIAEIYISAGPDRTFRAIGIEFPGLAGLPVWDGNPEVFELDPNKLGLANVIIPAGSSFSAVGAIGFEFGGYELWPTVLTVDEAPLGQAVRERQRAEFTIGSLNVFRLFDDFDDPSDMSVLGRTRDDFVASSAEYSVRRAKLADYIVNVLDAPDILAIQEVEKLGVLEDLAADIAAIPDVSVGYSAYLIEGNDIGTIDVGFLVRDTVAVDTITQINKDEILDFDMSLLHDRPPLLLEGRLIGDGADYPLAVMVVHNRSLGGIDSSSRGARVRAKRLAQAQSIALKVQELQTDNPGVRLVVIGDLNAFEFTDGYVDVIGQISGTADPAENLLSGPDEVDPDLINQVLSVAPAERYSFNFRGNAQALDHALTSMALDASIRGLEYGRGNSDAAADLIADISTPLRSSDHDGLVLFVTTDLDDDGVNDDADVCPGTVIPETLAGRLKKNRYALINDDFVFDVGSNGKDKDDDEEDEDQHTREFSTVDTAGCSCTQIVAALGKKAKHAKNGCSEGTIRHWIEELNEDEDDDDDDEDEDEDGDDEDEDGDDEDED